MLHDRNRDIIQGLRRRFSQEVLNNYLQSNLVFIFCLSAAARSTVEVPAGVNTSSIDFVNFEICDVG